jgi:hypothetical protein
MASNTTLLLQVVAHPRHQADVVCNLWGLIQQLMLEDTPAKDRGGWMMGKRRAEIGGASLWCQN